MVEFEQYKVIWSKTQSYLLDKDTMIREFGENIARVMFANNPKDMFIALLFLNDSLLDKLGTLEYEIEELKKCSRCETCENIYKCKVNEIERELEE